MTAQTWLRRAAPWAGAAVLLVAAWGVGVATPPEYAIEPAHVVTAQIGEEAGGRNIVATVTDVRAARGASTPTWQAPGTWLVVDLDAAAVVSSAAGLRGVTLQIGDLTFRASERMESFFGQRLVAGVPRSGSVAFELPEGALTGTAVLSLSTGSDTRGDSVIQVPIDLDALPVAADAELLPNGWSAR
ncbi:hypothetical protein ACFU0W_13745 [Microbacterium keratanolyticum]|uniref:hypothetical protein n=1 Tax=Microbacterium keratanolyticum TaxID=67574 RepID=UPI0036412413